MIKEEIDIVIGILKGLIQIYLAVDPNMASSKVVIAIQNVINTLQAIGI